MLEVGMRVCSVSCDCFGVRNRVNGELTSLQHTEWHVTKHCLSPVFV